MIRHSIASILLFGSATCWVASAGRDKSVDNSRSNPSHILDRDGIKSSDHVADAINGSVDFAIGDLPLSVDQASAVFAKRGVRMLNLPTAITASVPSYNLPGVGRSLALSPDTLAGICLGRITVWNDPAISRENPGVPLPSNRLVLIQQTNENGGTDAWTTYLSTFSKTWKRKIGRTRALGLPVQLTTDDAEATAELVRATPYSFAFVELWAARKAALQFGKVRNKAGLFVRAAGPNMTAAVGEQSWAVPDPQPALVAAGAAAAYPICNFTWIVLPEKVDDKVKRQKLVAFVTWVLTDGQQSTDALNYGRLPAQLVKSELKLLSQIQ